MPTSHSPIQTKLSFYEPGGPDAVYVGLANNPNLRFEKHEVSVEDVRGQEDNFNFDSNGFQFVKAPTEQTDFRDESNVQACYYKEVEKYLMEITGATRAYCFQHQLRQSRDEEASGAKNTNPVYFVHADFSVRGSWLRFDSSDEVRPADWEQLSRTRWGAVSFWRPLNTITRDQLAVVDNRSLENEDLRPYALKYPNGFEGEGDMLAYNPGQKWYYKSEMTADNALVIKLFDSKIDGRARLTPHSSFQTADDYGDARRSIEVRALVFWEDQSLE